jgi:citrate lyase subunit beta / citryl-CoA lyase
MSDRRRRGLLFIPGGNEKLLNKGLGLEIDGLILDLEDSVSPEGKTSAREAVIKALKNSDFGGKEKVVRVNAFSSDFGPEDIEKVVQGRPDTLLVPKVNTGEDILTYDRLISETEQKSGLSSGGIGLIALIETPLGIVNIDAIAVAAPRLQGLLFGAADFTRETGGRITEDRQELYYPLMRILLAARIAGLDALDTPYFDINDLEGLERHARQAKNMGYDGKALIHPAQVEIVNRIFTPTQEEIKDAHRVIEAFHSAGAVGKGVVQLDGKLIENVHVAMAERVLMLAAQGRIEG